MTHPELWDDIHRGSSVKVHRGEIQSFANHHTQLEDGSQIQADMVVLATGWRTTHSLFSSEDQLKYGLPSSTSFDDQDLIRWAALECEADRSVLKQLPLLQRSLDGGQKEAHATYRLYRHIIPVPTSSNDRNIAYIGILRTAGAPLVYEAQSLWAVAYLTGQLDRPSASDMEREIAQTNAWIRRRYICGWKVPFALFDFMPYIDMLYCDLGVNSQRKCNVDAEIFGLYVPADFKGIVDEWLHHRTDRSQGRDQPAGNRGCQGALPAYAAVWVSLLAMALCIGRGWYLSRGT